MANKFNQNGAPFSRETLTVSNAVKVLTASVYNDGTPVGWNQMGSKSRHATAALITVDTAGGIRYTTQGTDPVAGTTGTLAANSGTITAPLGPREIALESYAAICAFKGIRDAGADIVIQVEYFR